MAHPLHEHFRKTPQACVDATHLSPRHKEEPGFPESLAPREAHPQVHDQVQSPVKPTTPERMSNRTSV